MSLRKTQRYINLIDRNLNHIDGGLSHDRILLAIRRLVDTIAALDDHDGIWYQESNFSQVSPDNIIVGSFWWTTGHHSGQASDEYLTYCKLSEIFSPGMSNGCEPESQEQDIYSALCATSGHLCDCESEFQ